MLEGEAIWIRLAALLGVGLATEGVASGVDLVSGRGVAMASGEGAIGEGENTVGVNKVAGVGLGVITTVGLFDSAP